MAFTPDPGGGGNYPLPNGGTSSANAVENDLRKKAAAKVAAKKKKAAAPIPQTFSNPGMPADFMLDASLMAQQEFAPQYQLLDQMGKQAQDQYGRAGKDIGGAWDALAKAQLAQEGGIKKNYASTGSAIGKAYNDATAAVNDSFSDSRGDIAEIAKRLGVEAAVPGALSEGAEQQSRLVGLMNAGGANYRGLNATLGNNDVSYNREGAHLDKQAGINARQGFKQQLLDALGDLSNKRLDLKGQESAAKSKYGLSIADMQGEAARAAQDDQMQQARLMLEQARFGLDTDKFNASQNAPGKPVDTSKLSPYELVASLASKLYPNTQAASNATNAVTDTFNRGYNGDRNWSNAAEFVDAVMRRNPQAQHSGGDYRQLQQMALEFYSKLAGGASRPFTGSMG